MLLRGFCKGEYLQGSLCRSPFFASNQVSSIYCYLCFISWQANARKERQFLVKAKFRVVRSQSRGHVCKRCGRKFDGKELMVEYPSTGKNGNQNASAVGMHVECATKDAELVSLAEEGRAAMNREVIGFDALEAKHKEKAERLIQDLTKPPKQQVANPPFPESQLGARRALVPAAAPKDLCGSLLPFQAEGLSWMLQQEESESCGGILADEMGMGKTLQIISLILASSAACTLVVVPLTSLYQWEKEVRRFTHPGSVQVVTYYRAGGKALPKLGKLMAETRRTIVLTTFNMLASKAKGAARDGHGGSRKRRRLESEVADSSGEERELPEELPESPLFQIVWHRVVLDEAHRIRNSASVTSQAALRLQASMRWCVSGTPLQNRIGEISSMVRFLRARPYAYLRCNRRGCSCECYEVICKPGTQTCNQCSHGRARHRSVFTTELLTPIRQYGVVDKGKTAMEKLRFEVAGLLSRNLI